MLLVAVEEALATERVRRRAHVERERIAGCFPALTERERQVLVQVVAGRLYEQIAADLGKTKKSSSSTAAT